MMLDQRTKPKIVAQFEKYRAPIIQYEEIIPQTWWQRFTRQNPQKRLRIKRLQLEHFNCRCSFDYIIKKKAR